MTWSNFFNPPLSFRNYYENVGHNMNFFHKSPQGQYVQCLKGDVTLT